MNRAFWQNHPGLIWSNPDAEDAVWIRAALLKPRFHTVLAIAVEFGLPRLETEWQALRAEADPQTQRAAPMVERMLRNIQTGFTRAQT